MKRLTVVAYAINGRGVGHLVRQLAILRWIRRYCGALGIKLEAWVLTSSEADTLARREGFPCLKIPSKAALRDAGIEPHARLAVMRTWVLAAIGSLRPDLLVVDTFPGGSYGELVAALELVPQRVLVARRVREEIAAGDAYRALLPLFHKLVVPDDGEGAVEADPRVVLTDGPVMLREREELLSRTQARSALGIPADRRAVWVSMGGGGDPDTVDLPGLVDRLVQRGWWVVAGAGPLYSGPERRGPNITWIDRYASSELLPGCDAAVSAGGYNSFHELMQAGLPTVFLPQEKIADDQRQRVMRAVDAGAGRIAASLGEVADLLESPGTAAAARSLVPRCGSASAAAAVLSTVVGASDLAAARRIWTPGILGRRTANALSPERLVELIQLMVGDAPAVWADRRAVLLDLADRGAAAPELIVPPSSDADALLQRIDGLRGDPDLIAQTVIALARRFPAAPPRELLKAADRLLPVMDRFADWPGALALVRALPTQRQGSLAAAADALCDWLGGQTDMFDAQRALVRIDAGGQRTLAESLHLLVRGGSPAEDDEGLIRRPR